MKKVLFILVVFLFVQVIHVKSQIDSIETPYDVSDTLQDNFGLFSSNDLLHVSLRFDVTKYRKERSKDKYLDAILTYHLNEKDSINKNIRLKSRGEFRNSYCSFPPIRLNFKKTDSEKSDLKKIDKVKMVTHCMSGNENYLFKEYLAYKLLNVLTDYSFRVRLMKVSYIDTKKNKKPIESYAFLIEPDEALAERLKLYPVGLTNLGQVSMKPEFMDRLAIFNYMIGNTDWSVPNQHNCKIFSQPTSSDPQLGVVIPYDFDYSGLVDASYAIPHEDLGIKTVRDRLYLGICRDKATFERDLVEFKEKKDELYKVISGFNLLSDSSKKGMIKYLDTFFEILDDKNRMVNIFLSECRNL